jgi:hypothetical protein
MIRILASLAIMVFLVGIKVYGAELPAIQQTTFKATLDERDIEGHEIGIGLDKELDLQNAVHASGQFRFNEEKALPCNSAQCPTVTNTLFFTIVDRQVDRCGNTKYTAVEFQPLNGFTNAPRQTRRRLEVVDHRNLHCAIHEHDGWEVSLYQTIGHLAVTRYFTGKPKAVPVENLPLRHVYY